MKHISPQEKLHKERLDAIYDLEKKIASKKINLQGQDLACHRAVLSLLKIQIRKPNHTRIETARQVAECYGRGTYVAKKIVTWEIQWMTYRAIEEGNRAVIPNPTLGLITKEYSWLYVNVSFIQEISRQHKS